MLPTEADEIIHLRERLITLIADVDKCGSKTPPYDPANPHPISREVKECWWSLWLAFLDCILALDSIMNVHTHWFRRHNGVRRTVAFRLFLGAFLAQYRQALDFIASVEKRPDLDPVLNDSVPEMSLPSGTYDAFKFRFLNVRIGTEFALLQAAASAFNIGDHKGLNEVVEEDSNALWRMGKGEGTKLTARNALAVIRKGAIRTWFPVQRGISLSLSHLRLPVRGSWLIRPRQVKSFKKRLQPGDILLQRREWAFTNLGLPGFWTHAALYIGMPSERSHFENDPETNDWLQGAMKHNGGLESYLSKSRPELYGTACSKLEDGHKARIIEALGPGVILTSLYRSCSCDGLAVLRPRLKTVEKASAIVKAFSYLGRPYDFQFDFATDSALVCSELVFKAYEPSSRMKGLNLPLVRIAGRALTPPNEFARLYDKEADSEGRQFNLVMFIDGNERTRKASEKDESAFRSSWKRPKWHVFNQMLAQDQQDAEALDVLRGKPQL